MVVKQRTVVVCSSKATESLRRRVVRLVSCACVRRRRVAVAASTLTACACVPTPTSQSLRTCCAFGKCQSLLAAQQSLGLFALRCAALCCRLSSALCASIDRWQIVVVVAVAVMAKKVALVCGCHKTVITTNTGYATGARAATATATAPNGQHK